MRNFISGAAIAASLAFAPGAAQAQSEAAPGQSRADYYAWLARAPEHRNEVISFRDRLADEGVESVVPVWQLVRTSHSWRQCAATPFEVAPARNWDHIVTTLRFVRDQVVPSIGAVEALSGYRNEGLNACSNGAPASAHRMFFALDLVPIAADVTRDSLIRGVCTAHAKQGQAYEAGLGFYSGVRFHVDSRGYRKWGPDGSGATSPCTRIV
ncbi:hypothetical protein [Sphingosinicella sp. CPCC 101087]|uniref:hypothetical protein n=1 Tax=Sphingosinicella sp. CPCC 101087 TaxID=2497754 RepID=UPI00101C0E2E|nr:hypothetical protein [Sphingosinicella sp. CPCC 101087]